MADGEWQVMLKLLADTELDPRPEPYKTKVLEKKPEDAAAATAKQAVADAEAAAKKAAEDEAAAAKKAAEDGAAKQTAAAASDVPAATAEDASAEVSTMAVRSVVSTSWL